MKESDFKKIKKVYFIGIGGIGMSAIARMFLLEEKEVSGSDLSASEVTDELKKFGGKINFDQTKSHIEPNTDLVVYTVAIPKTHPELLAAQQKGIKVLSYPEILGIISKNKFTIAVAGTHGKTTTTAMIAKIMIDAGLDPTVIIGSFLKGYNSNFIAGKSNFLVVEACEYKRSFLNIHPKIAVITNIDDDHLDYYGNLEGIQRGFTEFSQLLGKEGILVTDVKHPNLEPVIREANSTVLDYDSTEEKIKLKLPGKHNIQNAKAAFVVASALGISEDKILKSLEDFSGTWRRSEYLGETSNGTIVYDDYGHHPSEIKATLSGFREIFPNKKIIVVFQPHLYSRTKEHFDEFGPALKSADEVILAPIYAAREPDDGTVSSSKLAEKVSEQGIKVQAFSNFETIVKKLKEELQKDDVLITMGAGDVNKVAQSLLQ